MWTGADFQGRCQPAKIKNKNSKPAHVLVATCMHTILVIMNVKEKAKYKAKVTATNIKMQKDY